MVVKANFLRNLAESAEPAFRWGNFRAGRAIPGLVYIILIRYFRTLFDSSENYKVLSVLYLPRFLFRVIVPGLAVSAISLSTRPINEFIMRPGGRPVPLGSGWFPGSLSFRRYGRCRPP